MSPAKPQGRRGVAYGKSPPNGPAEEFLVGTGVLELNLMPFGSYALLAMCFQPNALS